MAVHLSRRLNKVLKNWPIDSSRKGRDLGEYLHQEYRLTFEKLLSEDIEVAKNSLQSLENLNNNCYWNRYPRKHNHGFIGDIVAKNPWILSNENMKQMNVSSMSLWQRFKASFNK
ncbi:PREDICTED: ubiquinol-cytochrome-c reductase complex assembly factor 2-like [Amphimedon queenslandica]|uniref:Mitochondrial nucleoid factor 1 n=1 Tax=Amphimedon queenslandica TaxID=400682 RepID=A0A1X7U7H6_AMPQE|nr:PREDICTED: ubiquinol-cytochrome-c reductase complex assembly factor 2-like [Amphimedon queenslandica]|eukprot:XP_003388841.1 PREDICTED: ubiquinol-cytochrome-c reductase complex assembly factor 2-like [Amphimedon queenslandica]